MNEYTPTTDEVETHWADVGFAGDRESFQRWLAEVERAAAEKAWAEGARWAAVECGTILHEGQAFLAPGDNPHRPTLPGFGPKSCVHDGRAWPCPTVAALGLTAGQEGESA